MAKHGDVWRSPCGAVELRCGDWQTVLADVERVDAVITDPPYGERVHGGQPGPVTTSDGSERRLLTYGHITPGQVGEIVSGWAPRCGNWIASMTSDDLITAWRESYRSSGRHDFAPVPVLQHRPRLGGDGPGSGAIYMMVARPRERRFSQWGSLPCWYTANIDRGGHIGGKPLALMRAIVRDYSRPGDLICDPCAGGATTLLAAAMEGRRAIGAELDPETFAKAVKRLEKGWTVDMFSGAKAPAAEQMALGGTDGE